MQITKFIFCQPIILQKFSGSIGLIYQILGCFNTKIYDNYHKEFIAKIGGSTGLSSFND
jgi:hypothetical protein